MLGQRCSLRIQQLIFLVVNKGAVGFEQVGECFLGKLGEDQVIELDLGPQQVGGITCVAFTLLLPELDVALESLVYLVEL